MNIIKYYIILFIIKVYFDIININNKLINSNGIIKLTFLI